MGNPWNVGPRGKVTEKDRFEAVGSKKILDKINGKRIRGPRAVVFVTFNGKDEGTEHTILRQKATHLLGPRGPHLRLEGAQKGAIPDQVGVTVVVGKEIATDDVNDIVADGLEILLGLVARRR